MDQFNEKQYAFTNINACKLSFEWKIYNFKVSGNAVGEPLLSPEFSDSEKKTVWYIDLYPSGDNDDSKEYLSIFLYLKSTKMSKVEAEFKFCIFDKNGIKSYYQEGINIFKTSLGFGWHKYVKKASIMNNTYLPNNSLTIACDLTVGLNEITSENALICDIFTKRKLQYQLLSNYKSLFNNEKVYDLIIIVSERKFYAHKAILAAHSPVFLAMFNKNNFKEEVEKEIIINDIDSDVFQELLRFIYSGEIKNMNDFAYELLVSADKYLIKELINKCEQHLYRNLNVDNVVNIIYLADKHNAINLKRSAISFFTTHRKVIDIDNCKFFETLNSCTVQEIVKSLITQ